MIDIPVVDNDDNSDPFYARAAWSHIHRMSTQGLIWLATTTTDQDTAWACEAELDRRDDSYWNV